MRISEKFVSCLIIRFFRYFFSEKNQKSAGLFQEREGPKIFNVWSKHDFGASFLSGNRTELQQSGWAELFEQSCDQVKVCIPVTGFPGSSLVGSISAAQQFSGLVHVSMINGSTPLCRFAFREILFPGGNQLVGFCLFACVTQSQCRQQMR